MSRRFSRIERLLPLPDGELWIFGYGSLMWRPGFPHREARLARLNGLHRALCVWSWHHRGTRSQPGLVMGLDRGGSVIGRAYRIAAADRADVLDYLYEREMVTPVYQPRLRSMRLDRARMPAMVFVVDRTHPQYAGRLPADRAAGAILQGRGASGGNLEYLDSMVLHLEALGIHDPRLAEVRALVGGQNAAIAGAYPRPLTEEAEAVRGLPPGAEREVEKRRGPGDAAPKSEVAPEASAAAPVHEK